MAGRMMTFSPDLFAELLRAVKPLGIPVEEKSMFGHRTLFLNGYMFAGASTDGIWLRVGEDLAGSAPSGDPGLAPFEPRKGMVMKDYLLVKKTDGNRDEKMKRWLRTAAERIQKLPPKRAAGRTAGKGRKP